MSNDISNKEVLAELRHYAHHQKALTEKVEYNSKKIYTWQGAIGLLKWALANGIINLVLNGAAITMALKAINSATS